MEKIKTDMPPSPVDPEIAEHLRRTFGLLPGAGLDELAKARAAAHRGLRLPPQSLISGLAA